MNKKTTHCKILILAAAFSLGLGTSARAGDGPSAPQPAGDLLGRNYAGVTYDYYDLGDGAPSVARGYTFEANIPVRAQLDFKLTHEYARAVSDGFKERDNTLYASAVGFAPGYTWGKPYVEAGAGWIWQSGTTRDDSFAFRVGTGAEFAVAPSITLTPFVNFQRATHFNVSEVRPGLKACFRLGDQWGAVAKFEYVAVRHDTDSRLFSLGANYRF
jgi:opacity protein-like surface antigen